jgi:hypothetical protein
MFCRLISQPWLSRILLKYRVHYVNNDPFPVQLTGGEWPLAMLRVKIYLVFLIPAESVPSEALIKLPAFV